MIELEIQALSERREGLLIEVGRLVLACGFALQRQRLVQDPHGILLTMVVRGPPRRRRALASALEAFERFISFELTPFVEGATREHFAASRPPAAYTPPPAPPPLAATVEEPEPAAPSVSTVADEAAVPAAEFELIVATPPRAAAPPAAVVEKPFVEVTPEEPDLAAVDLALAKLADEYPQILPRLLALDAAVAPAAREPSLALAGRRVGVWLAARAPAPTACAELDQALAQALPALSALVEAVQDGNQLHIRHSPLCGKDGHSGCSFYGGLLEGMLGPALGDRELTVFPVCCRSYGADDCVLALSD